MRPDTAVVVTHRIVGGTQVANGAYSPPGEHIGLHHAVYRVFCLFFVCYAAPQAMAGIAGYCRNPDLFRIESLREKPPILHPECAVEEGLQSFGLGSKAVPSDCIALASQQLTQPFFGCINISLYFGSSERCFCECAIRELSRVATIFPDLVTDATGGLTPYIFYKSIPVNVAIPVYPINRTQDIGQ